MSFLMEEIRPNIEALKYLKLQIPKTFYQRGTAKKAVIFSYKYLNVTNYITRLYWK